jgi:hypothetical protein
MKIRDDDPFFTLDVPVLRIRTSTSAEAARRAERWARSKARKLQRQLKAEDRTESRTGIKATAHDANPDEVQEWLSPREIAAGWSYLRALYDGLFLDEDEEELARLAYREGGSRWSVFRKALAERKRDREAESRRRYRRGML